VSIGYRRDDVELGFEQGGDMLTRLGVIIHHQYARAGHGTGILPQ
jgi:hypothetical protein